ncbi:hypothetical protein MUNTM_38830 [Mycobacterium sp. MUNTM1]
MLSARDLSAKTSLPKTWPRYVRINSDLPRTETHKVLKRELSQQGVTREAEQLWTRAPRTFDYQRAEERHREHVKRLS